MSVISIEEIKEKLKRNFPKEMKASEEYFESWRKNTEELMKKKIESNDLFITHYMNDDSPEREQSLRLLQFVTADSDGLKRGRYHWAYSSSERITKEGLENQVEEGYVIMFPKPILIIAYGQMPVMDKNGIVYIIDHEKLEHKISCWDDLELRAVYDSKRKISLI